MLVHGFIFASAWARRLLGLSGEEAAGLGSEGKRAERAGVGLPGLGWEKRKVGHGPV